MTILADSSAWVELTRATGSEVDRALVQLLDEGSDVAVTEPVVMEVLAAIEKVVVAVRARSPLAACDEVFGSMAATCLAPGAVPNLVPA